MPQQGNSTDAIQRLQEETMRRLDSIASEIDAGTLAAEAGSERAEAIVRESQARNAILVEARAKEVRRRKFRVGLLIGTAILGLVAYFTFRLAASGPAL